MNIGEMIVRLVGIVLVLIGLALILTLAGVSIFGVHQPNEIVASILGVLCIAGGVVLIRGGNVTL